MPGYDDLLDEAATSMVEEVLDQITLLCEMAIGLASEETQIGRLHLAD